MFLQVTLKNDTLQIEVRALQEKVSYSFDQSALLHVWMHYSNYYVLTKHHAVLEFLLSHS